MIVYTAQSIQAYETLIKQGYLTGSKAFVFDFYVDKYLWLINQMNTRLKIDSKDFPIWVWDKPIDTSNLDKDIVILTLNIPDELILWSDFDAWNCLLHNSPIAYTEDEWELKSEKEIQATWERIFDFNNLYNHDYWKKDTQKQGTIFKIFAYQIVQIQKII